MIQDAFCVSRGSLGVGMSLYCAYHAMYMLLISSTGWIWAEGLVK